MGEKDPQRNLSHRKEQMQVITYMSSIDKSEIQTIPQDMTETAPVMGGRTWRHETKVKKILVKVIKGRDMERLRREDKGTGDSK